MHRVESCRDHAQLVFEALEPGVELGPEGLGVPRLELAPPVVEEPDLGDEALQLGDAGPRELGVAACKAACDARTMRIPTTTPSGPTVSPTATGVASTMPSIGVVRTWIQVVTAASRTITERR